MKPFKVSFVALVCFTIQFATSQQFRKTTATNNDPEKRELVKKASGTLKCVKGSSSMSGGAGKAGGKGGKSGKAGGKGGKSGKANKDRLLYYSKNKDGGKDKSASREMDGGKDGTNIAGKKESDGKDITKKNDSKGEGGEYVSVGKGSFSSSVSDNGTSNQGKRNLSSNGPGKGVNVLGKRGSSSGASGKGTNVFEAGEEDGKNNGSVEKCAPITPKSTLSNPRPSPTKPKPSPTRPQSSPTKLKPSPTKPKVILPKVPPPSFENIPVFDLTVINGSGDGKYSNRMEVTINANRPDAGFIFRRWKIIEGPDRVISDTTSSTVTLTMPNKDVSVKAIYTAIPVPVSPPVPSPVLPEFDLTVENGTGDGKYSEGMVVTITTDELLGCRFIGWNIISGPRYIIADFALSVTTLTMPNQNVRIGAICAVQQPFPSPTLPPVPQPSFEDFMSPAPYNLIVLNGSGDGTYSWGKEVNIAALRPTGQGTFVGWTIVRGPSGIISDIRSILTTLKMPAENITVKAEFSIKHELIVTDGFGDGRYKSGTEVTIIASPPSNGQSFTTFVEWVIVRGPDGIIANNKLETTNVIMPADDVTIRAIYFTSPPSPSPVDGSTGNQAPPESRSNSEGDMGNE